MTKNLNYYLELKYPLIISEGIENGEPYFEAEIPELSGCGSFEKPSSRPLNGCGKQRNSGLRPASKGAFPYPNPSQKRTLVENSF